MRILVTGGNGFIGSHLVDRLTAIGEKVTVLDLYPRIYGDLSKEVHFIQGTLNDMPLINRTLEDHRIDVVYHTAWSTIHETALKDPSADIQSNLLASINLLNACRETGVHRVIYLSSGGTVYGMSNSLPISECHPTNPINPYGITKLAVEKYLQMYYYLYGIEYIIFRPSVPYGPRQNPLRRQGVISTFIYQALAGKKLTIWGDGGATRDYFYIEDLIDVIINAAGEKFTSNEAIYNLGGMRPYCINELLDQIAQVLSLNLQVEYLPARRFDVPHLWLDSRLALQKFGWQPKVFLEEGIQRTSEWLKNWSDNL